MTMTTKSGTTKLALPDITLCAADCLHPQLATRALLLCMEQCSFGSVKLFTDQPPETASFETVTIESLRSKDDYSRFVLQDLHKYVTTPFALVIQWDGYVTDARRWQPEFLKYDYIGAKWPPSYQRRIGNGGFSLRSHRLLQATAELPLIPGANEDLLIGLEWRPRLEREYGISFASEAVADNFSYEWLLPDAPTFGFHGLSNMWRHVADDEMIAIVNALDVRAIRETDYVGCMIAYMLQRNFAPFGAFYGRWRQIMPVNEVTEWLRRFKAADQFIADCVRIGERLLAEEEGFEPSIQL